MSGIYIQEPPTIGKVLLETTIGDIDIELWSREAPKTCRNFVQLCLEGYYEETIFHRVVKGFIAQGGDPTGTGTGGESIYGKPFKDEFHSRLRFVRRGLVAMANAGKDDNGSQFFFTFAASPELQNKHTIFGKVSGNTIYNMVKLETFLVGKDGRPVYPPKIIKATVLNNPFPDIIPRVTKKEAVNEDKKEGAVSKSRATKDFKLLSFGDEAEDDEEEINEIAKEFRGKSKSSHDLTDDPRLSSMTVIEAETKGAKTPDDDDEDSDGTTAKIVSKKLNKLKKKSSSSKKFSKTKDNDDDDDDDDDDQEDNDDNIEEDPIKAFLNNKKQKNPDDKSLLDLKKDGEKSLENKSEKKVARKRAAAHESKTLDLISKFRKKLQSVRDTVPVTKEAEVVQDDKTETAMESTTWLAHKLQFESHETKVKDANMKDEDTYEIFDPRNPINQRRREASKQAMRNKR